MSMSFLQFALAITSVAVMGALMFVMAKRKLRSAYPLFFAYIGINALAVVMGLAALRFASAQYFYIYWTNSTILMLVGFAVQYEVFVAILKPFSAVLDLGKMLFFWAAGFLFIAGLLTAMVTNGANSSKIMVAVDLCDRCVHLMQCGLMLLMVVFEKRLSFSWRSPGMGVALGLGINAAMDLAVSYAEGRFPAWGTELGMLNGVVFTGVIAFWAFRFAAKESAPTTAANSPSRLIIQRWNDALISYRQSDLAVSSAMSSFLPGVEQTVERVLARKIIQ
ncbi:MAG: putative rane protein [Candidatus Angelobacter sp.]|jgi:hypothetical protein|nr:putative rane protein [Candidatus Angelobacter sp.]